MAQLLSPVYTEALKIHNPSLNLCHRTSWQMLQKSPTSPWSFATRSGKRRGFGRVKVATDQDSFSTSDTVGAEDYYAVLGLVIIHLTLIILLLFITSNSKYSTILWNEWTCMCFYRFSMFLAYVYEKIFFFYQLPDATPEQIKKAYYSCMKTCHPDLSGNDPETTNFCTFINEVYEVGLFLGIFNLMLRKFVVSSFLTIVVQVLSDPVQRRVYDDIHGYSLTSINPFADESSPKDHVFVDEFSCIGIFESLLQCCIIC